MKSFQFAVLFLALLHCNAPGVEKVWGVAPGVHNSSSCNSAMSIFSTIREIYKDAELQVCILDEDAVFSIICVKSERVSIFLVGPDHGNLNMEVKIDGVVTKNPFEVLKIKTWQGVTVGDTVENDFSKVVEQRLGYCLKIDDGRVYEVIGSNKSGEAVISWNVSRRVDGLWISNKMTISR